MAQATKMGADIATLDARRRKLSGHICTKCGAGINQGDLLMVSVMTMDSNGRSRKRRVSYHRKCYGLM